MMRVLLDTHVLIWALENASGKLDRRLRWVIADETNAVYYSIASIWEVVIKHAIHPELIVSADELAHLAGVAGYGALPIHEKHVLALPSLTAGTEARGHKDPFDRVMLAQAKVDGLMLLTQDAKLLAYEEDCIYRIV